MRVTDDLWTARNGWSHASVQDPDANLVLFFSAPGTLDQAGYDALSDRWPKAELIGCSTGGEVLGDEVLDGSTVVSALSFDRTQIRSAVTEIATADGSEAAGGKLGAALAAPDLKAVFVLADGTNVNGSDLVRGIVGQVGPDVVLTGGLAGDGADFGTTLVGAQGVYAAGRLAAIGFYGEAIRIGHGSVGGWDKFGPERTITRSEGSVLYELDGRPALEIYKHYLGDEAEQLPGSALLYPLTVMAEHGGASVVRTALAVDEAANSMTFAGDVPQGYRAQFMRGRFEHLVDGAEKAAEQAMIEGEGLAVLVSCIGRKLLMGQHISDEAEAVAEVLGDRFRQIGFYSYGEISPHSETGMCELHNQTMTITTFSEN